MKGRGSARIAPGPGRTGYDYVLWAVAGLVFFFLVTPILVILPLSFNAEPYFTYPMPGWSLRWYQKYATDFEWQRATRNSFVVAGATMCLASVLGTMAALGLNYARLPFKAAIQGFLISPLVVPSIITALGIFYFFSGLGLTRTFTGLILAHTVHATPYVVVIVTAALAGFDASLPRAAASLGAAPLRAFLTVTLPVMLPGLASAAVFAFVSSFDETVIVLFIAGIDQQTLTRQIWKGAREEISPTILAVAAVMVLVSVLVLTVLEMLRRRSERLGGRGV